MSKYDYVSLEREGPKTVITMDDLDKRNCLSQGMIDDLEAAMLDAEQDDSTAVVLTGKEGIFCAGGDISSFTHDSTEAVSGRLFGERDFRRAFEAIEKLDKPVIAAVDGTALAGGFELALVSDFAIVGEDVEFGTPEPHIGIAPGVAYVRLTDEISHHRAMEIMLTGKTISGTEAVELGLFNEAVPTEEVQSVVDGYVEQLAAVAPMALTVTKKIANRHRGGEDKAIADLGIAVLLSTEDAKEGISAFLDKRQPEFTGE